MIRLIDAHTGSDVTPGVPFFPEPGRAAIVLDAKPPLFGGGLKVLIVARGADGVQRERWITVPTHTHHPAFPDSIVAIIPS